MTNADVKYVRKVLAGGLVHPPIWNLVSGIKKGILKQLLQEAGLEYFGTDRVSGPAVDYVIDFEKSYHEIRQKLPRAGEFGTILVLNVLEHTFEPLKVLDNALYAQKGYA